MLTGSAPNPQLHNAKPKLTQPTLPRLSSLEQAVEVRVGERVPSLPRARLWRHHCPRVAPAPARAAEARGKHTIMQTPICDFVSNCYHVL